MRALHALFLAIIVLAPWRAWAGAIVVSSKLDTEGALLGKMIVILLGAAGLPVADRTELGPTQVLRAAIVSGAIDLYPEYTGNAAFFFHEDGAPVWKNAAGGYARARSLDLAANHLVWLAPAPADNSWVLAMRADLAKANGLRSLDDVARWVNSGARVLLAASAEFVESPAGLPAFQTTYGFDLRAAQMLVFSGGDTAATCKAAASGISGVNLSMAYGTDGALAALDLVALDDPRRAQPIYAPAPVVREAALRDHPQIAAILAPAFATLDRATLRGLNERIAIEGEAPDAVARAYLESRRLIAPAHVQ